MSVGRLGDYEPAVRLLGALASPARLAIVDQISSGARLVKEIATTIGLSQPTVSQHLRILRDANAVRRVREGREVSFYLQADTVARIVHDAMSHAKKRH